MLSRFQLFQNLFEPHKGILVRFTLDLRSVYKDFGVFRKSFLFQQCDRWKEQVLKGFL